MGHRLLIHDLVEPAAGTVLSALPEKTAIFAARPLVRPCAGCFGCWTKTPGVCVIADRAGVLPSMLAASDELILVTRCVYGGYSPEVKAVLDRSIAYMLPFFHLVDREMHHTPRYDGALRLCAHLYGEEIGEAEREIAGRLVRANAVNLGCVGYEAHFYRSPEEIKEALS